MNAAVRILVLTGLMLFYSGAGIAADLTGTEAMELGYRVTAIRHALEDPAAPGAMQAVLDLGHDQRYYTLVRGWLMYQLQGDMSILESSQAPGPEQIRARADFVQRAIRALDLE